MIEYRLTQLVDGEWKPISYLPSESDLAQAERIKSRLQAHLPPPDQFRVEWREVGEWMTRA